MYTWAYTPGRDTHHVHPGIYTWDTHYVHPGIYTLGISTYVHLRGIPSPMYTPWYTLCTPCGITTMCILYILWYTHHGREALCAERCPFSLGFEGGMMRREVPVLPVNEGGMMRREVPVLPV